MKYELILSWKNPKDNMWIPVGRLIFEGNHYAFYYTYGAKNINNFKPFEKMDDISKTYESEELFPLFKNRLLQKSRPEYGEYLEWLDMSEKEMHPMEELSLTGGVRATDSLQLFPLPVKSNGEYKVKFFTHGMRYLASHYRIRASKLKEGDTLYLMKDIQNEYDEDALVLRTEDPHEIIGYCPKNYVKDFNFLIDRNRIGDVSIKVVKNNVNAPSQLRLLCEFRTKWIDGFIPSEHKDFQKITTL
ncbi:MAG: Unknown protein [uncultured Sulfurovum sp.]|uniref:HIRAN domain-containing protein n=1 Tax=uncultured Sulfurovum sp. TaxID=269237 RepID=A0A6S6TCC4_9BACT|nr:MAG: Unknown protein [uncultured Sulfurovum sp.]